MAENERFGREPCQVAVLNQDRCSLTYGVSPCNASLSANFLLYSEEFNVAGWPVPPDQFNGVVGQFEGLNILELEIPGSETSVFSSSTDTENLTVDGSGFTFTFVFERTAFAATVTLGLSILETLPGPILLIYSYSATFDTQTGAFISESDAAGGRTVEYVTEPFGATYQRVRVTIYGSDTGAVSSENIANFNFQGQAGDVFHLAGLTVSNDPADDGYAVTTGVAKLKTGSDKCFNTRVTCQDPENFTLGVLPLKFVNAQSNIPTDDYYLPSLEGVTVTPARLNPGGANRSANALGERASVSLSFRDHTHDDRLVDPYRTERAYDPGQRGTFWAKWRARNPYYMQRLLELKSGYVLDGALIDDITRSFVVTGFTGPDSSGRVTIQGKDVLTMAEDSKAQAPAVSTGKLLASITSGAGSATLDPAGVGDAEYPASGFIRIEKEVIAFTRSGDTLTFTGRGQYGTTAAAHDADSAVQICLIYASQSPQDIVYDLLTNYAGIPSSYLDKAQWDAEALEFLPRLYSAIIAEPEGVSTLIGELCQQMYFYIWFDERDGLVKLRSVRLAQDDEITTLDEDRHLIADSVSWRDLPEQLVTQVWVFYGQVNPTEKLDQADNYAAVSVSANFDSESATKNNLRRIKKVYSRWIDAGNASAADDLGERVLARYTNAPRQCQFSLDAKDRALWLGDYIQVTHRNRVDFYGQQEPVNLQIFQAQEIVPGERFQYVAQEFIPAVPGETDVDPNIREIPITSNLLNVNLRTLHDSIFGAPTGTETVTFIVRAGVTVGGYAAGGGVNVSYPQRDTSNDTYDGGNSVISDYAVGLLPILQRQGLGSVTTYAAGDPYPSIGNTDIVVKEYPASTAVNTGDWPMGVTLRLVVEAGAKVIGEGGNGSAHGSQTDAALSDVDINLGIPGGDGGHALNVQYPIEITNAGILAGGGGGGGVLWRSFMGGSATYIGVIGGGGGSGLEISDIKELLFASDQAFTWDNIVSQRSPAIGSDIKGGSGGLIKINEGAQYLYTGGKGGDLAMNGAPGHYLSKFADGTTASDFDTGSGGVAGKAVVSGASMITWVNRGDVRGDEVA